MFQVLISQNKSESVYPENFETFIVIPSSESFSKTILSFFLFFFPSLFWNIWTLISCYQFFYGSTGKESACNVGDLGSVLGLGRSPVEGTGYPFQHSALENTMDCIVDGFAKSQAQPSHFDFTSSLGQK